ncbi:hypothetical protein OPT61_g2868 [Boeremia exigua]|uniref:Uncharacterized protein n=1 Tax=Boeremia exigua TaxID=749465 RepID=A0ACC2IJX6_9PLEO|nr:hypothetical protein OPT61_g2868 [Boeremia exigua]
MSLLLVTAFRAIIVAILGICFTQHLWYLLRRRFMRLGLIEDLFQIRNNFWGLFNYQVVQKAPVLFLVASMSWLVPLATIYPPAAMTIQTELVTAFVNVNASTMNSTMTYERAITADANSLAYVDQAVMPASQLRRMMSYHRIHYMGASGPLKSLARFVMSSGQIVPMAPLGGENSSYTLTFYGPQIQCANFTLDKSLTPTNPGIKGNRTVATYNATWPETRNLTNQSVFTLTKTRVVGYLPAPRWAERNCTGTTCSGRPWPAYNATVTMVLEQQSMQCKAFVARYLVYMTYVRGIQNVEYRTYDTDRLQHEGSLAFGWNVTKNVTMPSDTKEYKAWESQIPPWKVKANVRALLDSVGSNLNYQYRQAYERWDVDRTHGYLLPNGSTMELGVFTHGSMEHMPVNISNNYTTLQDSVFNLVRFGRNSSFRFDPHSVLNITEASINGLLANVTISALSLNTWYGDLNVSDSTSQSVYRFSHPVNLFVPYALCLGLSLIVIALGLSALRLNGVSATDGGFLQVMMTTSRKTKMHQAVKQGSVGGSRNAPKELLDLNVRFGELIHEGETPLAAKYGFAEPGR